MYTSLDTIQKYEPYPFQDPLKLDNSKRETFRQCERKYFYTYVMGYKKVIGSTPLRYGIAWHKVMEHFYKHIAENGWTRDGKAIEAGVLAGQAEWDKVTAKQEFYDDYRTLPNLLRSFMQYVDHFAADEGFMEVISPEKTYALPMEITPEEKKLFPHLKDFIFTGKEDLLVKLNQQPWCMDHKSTGQALSIQKSRLHRRAQYMGYTYAQKRTSGVMPEGLLVVLHYLSAYKSKKTLTYGTPKIDFERVPQVFDEGDLRNWKLSFFTTAERLMIEMERGIWAMNHDSCYIYGRCSFCGLCEQNKPLMEENIDGFFQDKPWDVTEED